jgi:hypothetical protein
MTKLADSFAGLDGRLLKGVTAPVVLEEVLRYAQHHLTMTREESANY